MSLSATDIDRIAQLARLELAPPKAERMLGQINGFFDLVERMRAVDTAGVEPLAHPVAAVADVDAAPARGPGHRADHARSQPAQRAGGRETACSSCRR